MPRGRLTLMRTKRPAPRRLYVGISNARLILEPRLASRTVECGVISTGLVHSIYTIGRRYVYPTAAKHRGARDIHEFCHNRSSRSSYLRFTSWQQ